MKDPRIERLAEILVNFSCAVKPGENVLIEAVGIDSGLVTALIKEVYRAGGSPFVWITDKTVDRALVSGCSEAQIKLKAEIDAAMMSRMQAFIGIRGGNNAAEMKDVPEKEMQLYDTLYWNEVHGKIRVPKTKWVVLRYPTPSMAQMADMSIEAFEDYYFDVCTLDYAKMDRAMDSLVGLMQKTDRVRITGEGTDISFSIKGMPAIKCAGRVNIPDGEVFSAPLKDSVNGVISYNTPSVMNGFTYENIVLTFRDGKIIKSESNDSGRISRVFDADEGARYVGEFAIGVNPFITRPMKDTLFDEKIAGSFHFTPGASYDDCSNGNKSALHWDLVCIQTPEYGGGEIYFDDVLIRKDGLFVLDQLLPLNPENLK